MTSPTQLMAEQYHEAQDRIQLLLHKLRTNLWFTDDPGQIQGAHIIALMFIERRLLELTKYVQYHGGKPASSQIVCGYCKDNSPAILDQDGVLSGISKKPGRWAHANTDGHWGCNNPPTPIPGPVPYLFANEMIDFGIASECTEDDCEGRLVLDGVCTWCGKEYPGHQSELKFPKGMFADDYARRRENTNGS